MSMSNVPPGRRCKSDEGPADDIGVVSDSPDGGGAREASENPDGAGAGELCDSDGAGIGEPSDSADGIPSECDVDDSLVGTGLLRKKSRLLILSRIDSNLCFGMVDEAIART